MQHLPRTADTQLRLGNSLLRRNHHRRSPNNALSKRYHHWGPGSGLGLSNTRGNLQIHHPCNQGSHEDHNSSPSRNRQELDLVLGHHSTHENPLTHHLCNQRTRGDRNYAPSHNPHVQWPGN
jgi:hypothetical protein